MSDYTPASSLHPEWLNSDWDSEFVPPLPLWISVFGGKPLLFPGEAHLLYCRPGRGKTWFALAAALWMALHGKKVLYIDYEGTVELIRYRLKSMGATPEAAQNIAYLKALVAVSGDAAQSLAKWVSNHEVSLVVVDSVARALAAGDLDENSNADLNRFFGGLERVRATGAALLLLDHVGHKADAVELPSPRGASAKVDQVSVAYYFDQAVPWSAQQSGYANIVTKKCRFGVRAESDVAARMNVDVEDGHVSIRMEMPSPPQFRGVHNERAAKAVAELLSENDGSFAGIAEAAATVADRLGAKKEDVEAVIGDMVRLKHLTKEHKENGKKAVLRMPTAA